MQVQNIAALILSLGGIAAVAQTPQEGYLVAEYHFVGCKSNAPSKPELQQNVRCSHAQVGSFHPSMILVNSQGSVRPGSPVTPEEEAYLSGMLVGTNAGHFEFALARTPVDEYGGITVLVLLPLLRDPDPEQLISASDGQILETLLRVGPAATPLLEALGGTQAGASGVVASGTLVGAGLVGGYGAIAAALGVFATAVFSGDAEKAQNPAVLFQYGTLIALHGLFAQGDGGEKGKRNPFLRDPRVAKRLLDSMGALELDEELEAHIEATGLNFDHQDYCEAGATEVLAFCQGEAENHEFLKSGTDELVDVLDSKRIKGVAETYLIDEAKGHYRTTCKALSRAFYKECKHSADASGYQCVHYNCMEGKNYCDMVAEVLEPLLTGNPFVYATACHMGNLECLASGLAP